MSLAVDSLLPCAALVQLDAATVEIAGFAIHEHWASNLEQPLSVPHKTQLSGIMITVFVPFRWRSTLGMKNWVDKFLDQGETSWIVLATSEVNA